MSEHRMQMRGTDGLIEDPDFDEDLRWALEKFDGALGPDARPPADPEDEQDWSDWRDAWKVVRDRLLATRRARGEGEVGDGPA